MGIQHSEFLTYVVDAASHGLEGVKQFIQDKRVSHDIWSHGIGQPPALRGVGGKDVARASPLRATRQAKAPEWTHTHHISLVGSLHCDIGWKADLPPLHRLAVSDILSANSGAMPGARMSP